MSSQINFDPFPVLETDRFILRKLSKKNTAAFSMIWFDEYANKFLNRPDIVTVEETEKTILKLNNGIHNNGWIF